ncbi:LysR family transcriptional regulator [Photobacterium sanguinicancri]|uniref:LysR family transcriptional regulator n=1 Tax=Photobacterium sanguinicancri TaxID=875932 RepID=UPI0026E422B7|nr:LysR family transcriptional regulator [Photobacterium sanguinicancri]MDO6500745.1 LysR family transcriptional regulator [Photobacterium sanguinicancri]
MSPERAGQMVIFHCLVKAGNFTAAGKQLGVSTSHISKQLGALETALNVKLVQRTTRSFTLTEAGETYLHYCDHVVKAMQDGEAIMEDTRDEISGVLRLGISQSFGTMHLIPAIEQLQRHYPKLRVEISLFDHKADMIEDGLDLWITNYEHIPDGYVAQRLAETRFVVAASPEYLMHHPAPSHPKELTNHNCLTYQSRQRNYQSWSFKQHDKQLKIDVEGNYRVDLAEAVRDAAIAGWGIAYLATYLLTDEFKTNKLIQLLPEWQANQAMPFYAVYPSRAHLPKKISAVIGFFKDYIGDTPYWDIELRQHISI